MGFGAITCDNHIQKFSCVWIVTLIHSDDSGENPIVASISLYIYTRILDDRSRYTTNLEDINLYKNISFKGVSTYAAVRLLIALLRDQEAGYGWRFLAAGHGTIVFGAGHLCTLAHFKGSAGLNTEWKKVSLGVNVLKDASV